MSPHHRGISLRPRPGSFLILALAFATGACAGLTGQPEPVAAPSPPEAPRAPGTPGPPAIGAPVPPPPPPREVLAARHREQAQALERDGHLRRALDEWKIALTIKPDDPAARGGLRALEGRIEAALADRIKEGQAALARGAQLEARRKFLAALALDPSNKVAFDALQNQVRDIEFITHTVRAGETLASLAQRYYGDRTRLEVIWETNNLPLNPRLTPGMALKIPEIPGMPFLHGEGRRETPREALARPEATPAPPARAEASREEPPPQVNPLLAEAREAFDKADYREALADVEKFLASNPGNRDGLDLQKAALYRHAKAQIDQKNFAESYKSLTRLARLQPEYEDSAALLRQSRGQLVARHYSEGFRLYREEKLREAIAEWRIVLELEPQHANARKNIEQAERILKGLAERRRR